MRKDGTFIAVEVDDAAAADPELAAKLADVCPVDIYAVARTARARWKSSSATSTSACSAACASTRHPPARCGC